MLLRSELEDLAEEEDDHMVEELVTHSPEPHEPVEPEASVQPEENGQPGRLHPEQDLPHIFKVRMVAGFFIMWTLLLKLNLTYIYTNI